jgi:hypothetical protein
MRITDVDGQLLFAISDLQTGNIEAIGLSWTAGTTSCSAREELRVAGCAEYVTSVPLVFTGPNGEEFELAQNECATLGGHSIHVLLAQEASETQCQDIVQGGYRIVVTRNQ